MTAGSARSRSTVSIWAFIQYGIFAVLAYILAGAPLQTLLTPSSNHDGKVQISKEKIEGLVIPIRNLTCPEHTFKGVHVLSRQPLVVYIEGFLSGEEADGVVELSTPHFTPSTVWTGDHEHLDPSVRLSHKARVPRSSTTIQCIESRARAFQGWRPYVFIEKMWAQKYGPGGHYAYHYDWGNAARGAGRISSFMVWLGDECEGGGTRFPRLERVVGEEWCRFVECGEDRDGRREEEGMGVTFRPVKGNAVYWENMDEEGRGYEESWHAGLPVIRGEKIGLNIWSWYQEGWDPYQGDEGSGGV
ncbi:hypothetical protein CC80DRAFT_568297 [Byssothecium circinans]|uniref:Prolyl 4-hydroxylase alpha subunit domain-containing protein n=1 Tax=Byssothecium circinans TaxID=147558 RepID=A0A6A5TY45_9PLEO|nr:hypothetical protein CC80DRAFT_568297 [Byssothecium circinans]